MDPADVINVGAGTVGPRPPSRCASKELASHTAVDDAVS